MSEADEPHLETDAGRMPARLGPFRLLAQLGAGAMGTVYLAEDAEEVRRVALKVLHPHLLTRGGFFQRFQREALAGQRVKHPNVVHTLDCSFHVADGQSYCVLVMEYVEGRTLRSLLRDLGTVPEPLAREIARQVAEGLAAIHDAALVHRDLKPENVLITEDHRVRIMDLGVARHTELATALTQEGQFAGSVLYAAPEQFRGGSEVGPAVDAYALGVLLYELVTGVNPFRHDLPGAVVNAHLEFVPERLDRRTEEVSPFLGEVVATLLAKDATARFESAAALALVLAEGEQSAWWHDRECARLDDDDRRVRIPVRRETRLYGRAAELTLCREAWQRARTGAGKTLLLEGEAGIGKTRLVDAFLEGVADDEASVLYGSYSPAGGMGGIADALLEHFGRARTEDALLRYLPDTPSLAPALAAVLTRQVPTGGAPALSPDALQAVLVRLMRALAAERPQIWVVEDLHFAEAQSRRLVLALARAVEDHPILLLLTTRPGLFERELLPLGQASPLRRTTMGRLGAREVILLLQDAFRSKALAEKLGGKIALKSDGVPFFVFEMIQGLKEGQFISQLPDGSWVETKIIEDIEVPSAVRDLIGVRLQGFSKEERAIFDVGAVQGFAFDPDLVARVLERPRVAVLQDAADIERRSGVLRATGRNTRFDHHQIQEVLYESLTPALREEYHTLLARAFAEREEARADDTADLPGDTAVFLAEHGLRGRKPQDGLPYLRRAMDHLGRLHANERLIRLCDVALAAPGLLAGASRLRMLHRRDFLLAFLGRHGMREEGLAEARALAEASGDKEAVAKAEGATGIMMSRTGRFAEALAFYTRALDLHTELGITDGQAATVINMGNVLRRLGRHEEARAQFERGREHARACGNLRWEGAAAANLALLLGELGRYEEAEGHHERARALAMETGNRESEVISTYNLACDLQKLGRFDEAQALHEHARAIAEEVGLRRGEAQVAGSLGGLARSLGRLEEALEQQERALAISRELGDPVIEAWITENLARLLLPLGRPAEARVQVERSLDIARQVGEPGRESAALSALGSIHEASREPGEAERCYREALRMVGELGNRPGRAQALVTLASLLLDGERKEEAAPLLDEALALARAIGMPGLVVQGLALEALHLDGSADEASEILAQREPRLSTEDRMQAHFLLWRATGSEVHLRQAQEVLEHAVQHAPEAHRESMVENVRLHREILEAWEKHEAGAAADGETAELGT